MIADLRAKITRDADQCVMCGLCLPHCPTYRETRDEGESPRGRIALMSALAAGHLPLTPRLETHLDLCLTCRACEDVCPSQVPYGTLIDAGRSLIQAQHAPTGRRRRLSHNAAAALLGRPPLLRMAARLLRLYQRSGLARPGGRGAAGQSVLARMQRYLPPLQPIGTWNDLYPAPAARRRGRVALFTGCVNPMLDPAGIQASIGVLNALGYDVRVPKDQVCCGALSQHGGRQDTAWRFARRNLDAFAADVDTVISLASGCGATLKEYPLLLSLPPDRRQAATDFAAKCEDINGFITRTPWPEDVTLAPLNARVAVHDPCSMRRVLRQQSSVYELLGRIPGVNIQPLPGNSACCGAAGSYMLTQPDMADRLLQHKLDAVTASGPDILATSNIGCALHIDAGLRASGWPVQVMHPVTLIAQQMRGAKD